MYLYLKVYMVASLQILSLDESDQRLVIRTVVLVCNRSGVVHRGPGLLSKSGVADGGDSVAELAVDAATVVELLVGVARGALVLDAADAADPHDEDDEHEDEGYTKSPDDNVEGVTWHVGQSVVSVSWLPLQVNFTAGPHPSRWTAAGEAI